MVGTDQPIRDLEARWGITRNALKKRAAALGVDLIRVSSTDTRWPAAYVDLGDQLHQHLQAGGTLKDFPGSRASLTASTSATSESKLTKGIDAEVLAAVVAAAMAQHTVSVGVSADPLARAKGLADAADHALVLTTDELAALGVKGIEGFSDGDLAYGYVFSKHNQRSRVLWTVERAIKQKSSDGQPSLAPAKGSQRVGFDVAALMPPVTRLSSMLLFIK